MNEEIKVIKSSNGAIAFFKNCENEKIVYKYNDENIDDLIDLLYDIKNYLMPELGKFSKLNLEIKKTHGYKYECIEKKCEICKKGDAIND